MRLTYRRVQKYLLLLINILEHKLNLDLIKWLIQIYLSLMKKRRWRFHFKRIVFTRWGADRISSFSVDIWLHPTYNLLLVRSHQAEIIIVKHLTQGRNNVTGFGLKAKSSGASQLSLRTWLVQEWVRFSSAVIFILKTWFDSPCNVMSIFFLSLTYQWSHHASVHAARCLSKWIKASRAISRAKSRISSIANIPCLAFWNLNQKCKKKG